MFKKPLPVIQAAVLFCFVATFVKQLYIWDLRIGSVKPGFFAKYFVAGHRFGKKPGYEGGVGNS